MNALLADGIGGLIGLIIFVVISVIASLAQKKRGGEEEGTPQPPPRRPQGVGAPPPPPGRPAPQKPVSWEEELRRLLEGRVGEAEPAPPPPIIVRAPRRMPPAPPPLPAPRVPAPSARKSVFDVLEEQNPVDVDVAPKFRPLPVLSESLQTQQQAGHLSDRVEEHLRQVTQHPIISATAPRKSLTPEIATALALLRNPKSARSAILASVILGPPKALADS